jgi:hypothetical protein
MQIIEVQSKTDSELAAIRKSMPKYLNDMSPEQIELTNIVYAEQKRRYDEKHNQEVNQFNIDAEKAGYKVGQRVKRFVSGLFGISGEVYQGTIVKQSGIYKVKLDRKELTSNGYRKYVNLSLNWQVIPIDITGLPHLNDEIIEACIDDERIEV